MALNEKVYFRNPYSFKAVSDEVQINNLVTVEFINFKSVIYDSNNNWHTNMYTCPVNSLEMRVSLEQFYITSSSTSLNVDIEIMKNGGSIIQVESPFNLSSLNGYKFKLESYTSPYFILNDTDSISLAISHSSGSDISIAPGAIFSNSFRG